MSGWDEIRELAARSRDLDWSWQEDAACRGEDPDRFFPSLGRDSRAEVAETLEICAGCPVRTDCLEFAVKSGSVDGIWGGLLPRVRRRYRSLFVRRIVNIGGRWQIHTETGPVAGQDYRTRGLAQVALAHFREIDERLIAADALWETG